MIIPATIDASTLSHRALAYRPIFIRSAVNGLAARVCKRQLEAEYYLTGDQQFVGTPITVGGGDIQTATRLPAM
jgi:hypothetical protein